LLSSKGPVNFHTFILLKCMLMRNIATAFSLLIAFTCLAQDKTTQLAIERIQYIYTIKQALGNKAWPSFGKDSYNIPLIYYAGDTTFIANPHPKLMKQFNPAPIFRKGKIAIFKLDYRIDSTRMRMLVSMSPGPDTSAYDYNDPYMQCSSREEFARVSGFQANTQGWAAIVLHECFHGFQYLHSGYHQYAIQNNLTNISAGKTLQGLYTEYQWYKDYINTENDLLLKAIKAASQQETDSLVAAFFTTRQQRRSHIGSDAGLAFSMLEKNFETMEGTARFIEAYALSFPVKDKHMATVDPHFSKDNIAGSQEEIDDLSKATTGNYYYATGYNITRLLKKMKVAYDAILFKQPSITLEDMLREHQDKQKNKVP